jgi:hypothetical protein
VSSTLTTLLVAIAILTALKFLEQKVTVNMGNETYSGGTHLSKVKCFISVWFLGCTAFFKTLWMIGTGGVAAMVTPSSIHWEGPKGPSHFPIELRSAG